MTRPTVTVAIAVTEITGAPLPGARVRFELTGPDIDTGIVVPQGTSVLLDADGVGSAELWPNAAGTQGTQTSVTIFNADGKRVFSGVASIPEYDCSLHEVLHLTTPTVDDAEAAVIAARAAAAQARSVSGALLFGFDGGAVTDGNPGAGELRLNAATLSAATFAYMNNAEHGGADISAVLDVLDDSNNASSKAILVLREGATGKVAAYRVIGPVVEGAGYRKVPLAWIGGSTGTFADASSIGVTFSVSGGEGATGATGPQGETGPQGPQGPTGTVSAAGGIQFPATQSPSADPNTLDDYEEGTFTPNVTFDGASAGVAYAFREGNYTKVGRKVSFEFFLALNSQGSSTGQLRITGLPFTAKSGGLENFPVVCRTAAMTGLSGGVQGYVATGSDSIYMEMSGTGAMANITHANCTNNMQLLIAGTYFV